MVRIRGGTHRVKTQTVDAVKANRVLTVDEVKARQVKDKADLKKKHEEIEENQKTELQALILAHAEELHKAVNQAKTNPDRKCGECDQFVGESAPLFTRHFFCNRCDVPFCTVHTEKEPLLDTKQCAECLERYCSDCYGEFQQCEDCPDTWSEYEWVCCNLQEAWCGGIVCRRCADKHTGQCCKVRYWKFKDVSPRSRRRRHMYMMGVGRSNIYCG